MKKKRKIPSKAELLQLQKLYKTDEKIGERLGGVPAYLVAYWRRKKNVPKHSLPKFSEREIRNLWERYGDDEKAGLELGISKAAFYNWRRRYNMREKPAFLKLEQLEFAFTGSRQLGAAQSLYGKQSVVQKVLARAAGVEKVQVGDRVACEPDLVVVNRGLASVFNGFRDQNVEYVWNPVRIVAMFGSTELTRDASDAAHAKPVRDFVKRQNIKHYYSFGEGDCHQIALERGLMLPGSLAFGTHPEALSLGAISAISLQLSPGTMADLWAAKMPQVTVPETVRVVVTGRRSRGVYARDAVLYLRQMLPEGSLSGRVVEYTGSYLSQLSVNERFTLAALSAEMGAVASVCPYDSVTRRFLTGRSMAAYKPVLPDKNAEYTDIYEINVEKLSPLIAVPDNRKPIRPVAELEDTPVQQVVLGSGINGRFDDFRAAAEVLKGKHVHPDCRLMVIPASRSVYLEALKKGLIRIFVEAGAVIMYPGCHPFMETHLERLGDGERCLTTAGSLNMGSFSPSGDICYCSPATAATSALNGTITDPVRFLR